MYLGAVNLRYMSVNTDADVLQKTHQTMLSLLEKVIPHCGTIEPSGVGDLLRSSLSNEIDIVKIGTVPTSLFLDK